ncbi:AI-2E family transporter [Methylibium sp.]|uniref:AI-2E family transporter n=1 Tax=Methylibium sp. TaxID=2067992 RepID=UPI0025D8C8A9|nr:AI-2E family transporter [Methylibium sp.]
MTAVSATVPRSYTGRVVVAVSIVALAWLLWQLLDVIIVVFGAVLFATFLLTLAEPLHRRLSLPPSAALAAVVLLLLVLLVLGGWLVGEPVARQLGNLRDVLPQAFTAAAEWLGGNPVGQTLLEAWDTARVWSRAAGMAGFTLGALAGALLIVATGIFLAADPALYRRGLLRLLPPEHRQRVDDALLAAGEGLSRWLLGQGVSMLAVGVLTSLGLWLIGMPLALALGIIAAALDFVPYFGPIAAGLLIVLLAFAQGPEQALYAALLVLAIQQFESFVLVPFVQRWTVRLPPVLALIALMIFGLLFGPIGALFAVPLMVVAMILVQRLYVRDVVENNAPAAGRLPE